MSLEIGIFVLQFSLFVERLMIDCRRPKRRHFGKLPAFVKAFFDVSHAPADHANRRTNP